ncbi:hypothetical protein BB561_005360 [Smittium simulii]|uniref:Uncharacterized protein n=1 Tax=Smittium simulii TaxID=133385 RepID=A0A2T9YAV9_9FUNG|nr:hypothetical protein BB561_005360 [Smittium simulii]
MSLMATETNTSEIEEIKNILNNNVYLSQNRVGGESLGKIPNERRNKSENRVVVSGLDNEVFPLRFYSID